MPLTLTASGTFIRSRCVHQLDGASNRVEPIAELLGTRWAHALLTLTHEQRRARLEEARQQQPHLSKSLWLRRALAIDVAPCSGLAISAGTEDEHVRGSGSLLEK